MQLTIGRVSTGLVEHVLSIIILFFIFHGKTRSNPNNRNWNAMNFHKPCTCKLEEDSFTTNYNFIINGQTDLKVAIGKCLKRNYNINKKIK